MKKLLILCIFVCINTIIFAQNKQYIIINNTDTVGYKNLKDSVYILTKPVLFWKNYDKTLNQLDQLKYKEETSLKIFSLVNGNGVVTNIPIFLYLLSKFHYTENK